MKLVFPWEEEAQASKYQNHREYMGAIVGCRLAIRAKAIQKQCDNTYLIWVGDNTSALKWVRNDLVKGQASQYSNLVFAMLQILGKVIFSETEHIPGVTMGDIDNGSRGRPTPSLSPALEMDFGADPTTAKLMEVCDPCRSSRLHNHHDAMRNIHELVCDMAKP